MDQDGGMAARGMSLVVSQRPDAYSTNRIMFLCCLVSALEGADAALLPATILALEEDLGIKQAQIGTLGLVQALCQALSAPIWGIMASRAILPRKQILIIGCLLQGLLTVMLSHTFTYSNMMILRGMNGMMLASLRPISMGIIADIIPAEQRGGAFGNIFMSMTIGNAIGGLVCTPLSRQSILGFMGWQVAFVLVGGVSMLLAPLLHALLFVPPVNTATKVGMKEELKTLGNLMRMPTFAALVVQGCFGSIPWQAMNFRTAFFQVGGLSDASSAIVNTIGQFSGAVGSKVGGVVGDTLARMNAVHGRVITAEVSVLSGIPVAFFTFMVLPPAGTALMYYACLVIGLGLTATWCGTGVNPPILVSIASPDQTSLVIAWQTALEGAIGATGNFWVGFLAENVFGYDVSKDVSADNAGALGKALFWTSVFPWIFCGLTYTSLHFAYPRDLAHATQRDKNKMENPAISLAQEMPKDSSDSRL